MAVVWAWVGAVTPSTATVTVEVDTGPATLLVADNAGMVDPITYAPVTVDAQGVARLQADALNLNTQYWYQIQDAGVTDTGLTGRFRTHPAPGSQASFSIVAASCAGAGGDFPGVLGDELAPARVSNAEVFDTIRNRDPLMFVHLGDRGYYDLGSGSHGIVGGGSVDNYRKQYHDNTRQPRQLALCSQVPTQYVYDDHDWGPNDSGGDIAGRDNHLQVYRELVPHYPVAGGAAPVDQYWQIGRVAFVLSDVRADRTPNSAPDGPGKTMLGAGQKARLAAFLASSTAEALVWFMASQWMGTSTDSWAAFATERDELVALLDSHGWLDRMVMVYGDRHALGLDTGGNNLWGGFPVLQAASMDTSFPSSPVNLRFDTGPDQPGRNQYGVVDIDDLGSSIDITLSGFQGTGLWRSHTLTVTLDDGGPGPGPGPGPAPPVAHAVIRNRVTWLGCRLGDGRIIAELPDITGQVSRVIGRYTSASLRVPIPRGGPAAVPLTTVLQAGQPAQTLIVAVVNDIPTWAGIPLPRSGGTDAELAMGAVSVEGYLEHRFVRDHAWTQQDEAAVIAAGLLGDAGDLPGIGSGINLELDTPATGRLRDRTYLESDRKTVYEALVELMGVQGGPEWTIDLDWTDDTMTAVRLVARVRSRLGIAAEQPPVMFETTAQSLFGSRGSTDATYRYNEDLSGDRYANYVIAYSSGEGEDQPASAPAIDSAALAAGAPIWERHFQPSSSIVEIATLNDHAAAELARIQRGALTWEISARWDAYPRYGVDWQLGDDVAWQLVGHRHPAGVTGQGRVIGFELDMTAGRIRPVLQEA